MNIKIIKNDFTNAFIYKAITKDGVFYVVDNGDVTIYNIDILKHLDDDVSSLDKYIVYNEKLQNELDIYISKYKKELFKSIYGNREE